MIKLFATNLLGVLVASLSLEHEFRERWQKCDNLTSDWYDENIASVLNMPHTKLKDLDVGAGIDSKTGKVKLSPFNMKGYSRHHAKVSDSDSIHHVLISDSASHQSY